MVSRSGSRPGVDQGGGSGRSAPFEPFVAANNLATIMRQALQATANYLRVATSRVCSAASPLDLLPQPVPEPAPDIA